MLIETQGPYTVLRVPPDLRESIALQEKNIREFVIWIKKNKPTILYDIVCEECPEVIK